ncbi:hypothetical protein, partial [Pseudomonas syringae]
AVGSGIPVLSSILSGTISTKMDSSGQLQPPLDMKIIIDSTGNKILLPEAGGGSFQRIMWRQIQ